jgi:hypothetical protein
MKLELVHRSPGFASGAYGPLAISVWDDAPSREHAMNAASLLDSVARAHKEVLLLAVVGPDCPPPESAVREILAAELRRLSKQIVASANLVEGQGFRAAALRSVLTGMALLVRPPYPQKICATMTEASEFLVGYSGGQLTTSVIARSVDELRRG